MTLRERIVDLISGGALTRAEENSRRNSENAVFYGVQAWDACESLRRIADMETPSANATVRRMAAEARKGLGE